MAGSGKVLYAPSMKQAVAAFVISIIRLLLPLSCRKELVLRLAKSQPRGFYTLTFLLLQDFSREDPGGFHSFLWSHHLGHAGTYELDRRHGKSNVEPTRLVMLERLSSALQQQGIDPTRDVQSVLDAGCSVGHVLRYVETEVFPAASILEGVDLDSYAIEKGSSHLQSVGSKACLARADVGSLADAIQGKSYDVILCFGVLLYVDEATAERAIRTMLQHTRMLLAVSTWPHPAIDNSSLSHSLPARGLVNDVPDLMDGVLIHNLDKMVSSAGGRIISRCWTGSELVGRDKPLYFLIAQPSSRAPFAPKPA